MRHSRPLCVAAAALLSLVLLPVAPLWPTSPARAAVPVRAIFAGLQDGRVYRSADGGLSWQEADRGLPGSVLYPMVESVGGVLYAGPGSDGVYVSYDAGGRWQAANGVAAPMPPGYGSPAETAIYGLAVDPHDGRFVYAVGSPSSFYRSTNGGRTWAETQVQVGGFSSSTASALQLDPLRPTTLLLGSDRGLQISRDSGASWSPVGALAGSGIYDTAFSPSNPDVAYAATDHGMYQTIDGGRSWQQERHGIPDGTLLATVAVDPADPALVIATSDQGLVFRSTDGGSSWQRSANLQGERVTAFTFDAGHAGRVLAGTEDGSQIFVSDDNGLSWRPVPTGFYESSSVVSLTTVPSPPLPTDPLATAPSAADARYFAATGHSVRGAVLRFYDQYGGLKVFGLPLTEVFEEYGQRVQYFERVRLLVDASGVRVGALGQELTAGRAFAPLPPLPDTATQRYFYDTHHSLRGAYFSFWQSHHGALLFGSPISEVVYEHNGDGTGRTYPVQYCRNARLEYHPELAGTQYAVQVGLLGRRYLERRGWL